MRALPPILLLVVSCLWSGVISSPAWARGAGYCLECHSQSFVQKTSRPFASFSAAGSRSVYQAKLDPCPSVRSTAEEMFFTESRILKLSQILQTMGRPMERGGQGGGFGEKVAATAESFFSLRETPRASIAQFTQEATVLRADLQKVYDYTRQARVESSRRWLIGLGSLIFLSVLVLLGIGRRKLHLLGKTTFLVMLAGGWFILPACSTGPAETEKKIPAQERLEQSLRIASQSASRMEESFYRSFLLAEMAKDWAKIDAGSAEKGFKLAWQMAMTAREKAGKTKELKGILAQWPSEAEALKQKVNYDAVLDLRDEIRNTDGRTWGLRAVAEEWVQADRRKGRTALEFVSREAAEIQDAELRDRELKSIAEAWAGINFGRATEIAGSLGDPFLKAMALTNIALLNGGKDGSDRLLQEAWKAAATIQLAYPQTQAFLRIAFAAAQIHPPKKKEWAERALAQVQNLKDPQLQALATQELVYNWATVDGEEAERWAAGIAPAFPAIRAYSFLYLAGNAGFPQTKAFQLLKKATAEIPRVADSFETQKIQSLIAKSLARIDPGEALRMLPQIEDPVYRSEILGQLAWQFSRKDKRKGLALAEKIPLEAFRTKVIVQIIRHWMGQDREKAIGLYAAAFEAGRSISDPYLRTQTLLELAKSWGKWDSRKQTAILDLTLKSAGEISSPPMKAEILEALAESWKKNDKNKAQTILEGIDPSVSLARKLLEEIRLWVKIAPLQAYRWAEAFPSSFPLEKSTALKEVAISLKKDQPAEAAAILEKTFLGVLELPDGPRERQLLSQLVVELASLNSEKTFRLIRQVPGRELRDLLYKDAGLAWIKMNVPSAVKMAMRAGSEISESSLRVALYQKIADRLAREWPSLRADGPDQPSLSGLAQWGLARAKVKTEETEALPFLEKALYEIRKVSDSKERSYLLSGLTVEWAPLDEERALRVAGEISSAFPEPLSYALLQGGSQLRRWSREKAEAVFQKILTVSAQKEDSSLKAQRLFQLAQQWYILDQEQGKEVLQKAEKVARNGPLPPGKDDWVLAAILLARSAWEPGEVLPIARNAGPPSLKAKILLESSRVLSQNGVEENIKALEKAFLFAQRAKNYRLMSEIAMAWLSLDPDKGLEILAQVEPQEIRVQALRRMAKEFGSLRQEEAGRFLDQATREAMGIRNIGEKIKCLKEIAGDWAGMDKERAKAIYLKAFHTARDTELANPQF